MKSAFFNILSRFGVPVFLLAAAPILCAAQEQSESLFNRAVSEFNNGKYISARYDFSSLIERYPYSKYLSQSYLFLGKTFYNLHSYSEADSIAQRLRSVFPHTRYKDWTFYLQAACAYRMGNPEAALSILARLVETAHDSTVKTAGVRALDTVIRPSVDNELFSAEIKKYGIILQHRETAPLAESRKTEQVKNESEKPPPVMTDGTIRIGLVTSLTGMNGEYGSFLHTGVKAGFADGDSIAGYRIELIVEDTKSDAVEAVCAVRRLNEKGVIAIIGPVFSNSTITAAIESNALGIPFIAATATDRDLTRIGKAIFQLNFTPTAEAAALAEFAVKNLGVANAAIIASRDAWGKNIAETFSREMTKRKSEIIRIAYFTPDSETDDLGAIMRDIRAHAPKPPAFSDSLATIITTSLADTAATDSTYYSSRTLAPIRTIDAIFISATSRDAVKIANRLVEYNITASILGDSGWNDPSAVEDGKRFVEGAYLIAPPGVLSGGAGPGFLRTSVTNDDYRTVAMKGYDSAKILLQCIADGASDRHSMAGKIETVKNFPGSASFITIDPETHTNSAVEFVRIQNGGFTQVRRDAIEKR